MSGAHLAGGVHRISAGGDGSEQVANAATLLAKNPQVHFHNNRRGSVRCAVDERTFTSHYRVLPYVTRASFVVEDGDPDAHPA